MSLTTDLKDDNLKIEVCDSDEIVWRGENNTISYNSAIYGSGSEDQIASDKTENINRFTTQKSTIQIPDPGTFVCGSIRVNDIEGLDEKIIDGILYHESETTIKFIGRFHGRIKPTINKLNSLDEEYKLGKKKERMYATMLILSMLAFPVVILWLMNL